MSWQPRSGNLGHGRQANDARLAGRRRGHSLSSRKTREDFLLKVDSSLSMAG